MQSFAHHDEWLSFRHNRNKATPQLPGTLFNAEQQDGSYHERKSIDCLHGTRYQRLGDRLYGNAK